MHYDSLRYKIIKTTFESILVGTYCAMLFTGVYEKLWASRQHEIFLTDKVIACIYDKTIELANETKPVHFRRYRQIKDFEKGDLVDLVVKPGFTYWGLIDDSFNGISISESE